MANRLFLAVPVRLYDYGRIQNDYKGVLDGRWREERTLHATVAFLGNAYSPGLLLEKTDGFEWSFEPGTFDTLDYFASSRVFVATCENPTLQRLRERLESVLELKPEVLRPHVTLMRVKKISDTPAFLSSMPLRGAPIGIMESRIALYESRLTPGGAHYTILKEWHL